MNFFKKFLNRFEKKSNLSFAIPLGYARAEFGGWHDILAYQALIYYRMISPINTGINTIVDEFANIVPYVYEKKSKTYLDDHDVLELLSHPFGDMTWSEFATEAAIYYLVTGNNYTTITGNINKPPLEMMNMPPWVVTALVGTRDGYNYQYNVSNLVGSTQFVRDEKLVDKYFRFVNQQTELQELWHMRRFNPRNQPGNPWYGMSVLTPNYFEIEQHLNSSIHNKSLLKNGAKLSLLFTTDATLPQDSYDRLKAQMLEYSSPENAGKPFLADNGIDVKEMGLNNKDMDFLELKKEVTYSIYNNLKVPLPLVLPERTTLNNLENSMTMLYDRAVIPLANRILQELTLFLMPRYKGSEDLIITFKKDDITALEGRKLDQIDKQSKLGVFTINEIRSMLSYEEVEGGDVIFRSATDAPISSLANIDNDNKESPPDRPNNDEEPEKHLRFANGDKIVLPKLN
jgi:HK97 family phage portal protein